MVEMNERERAVHSEASLVAHHIGSQVNALGAMGIAGPAGILGGLAFVLGQAVGATTKREEIETFIKDLTVGITQAAYERFDAQHSNKH